MELLKPILEQAEKEMTLSEERIKKNLTKIQAGKATPSLFEGLTIECYGSIVPLTQVATVNNLDARTLVIKPWDKKNIIPIEKAILHCNHIDINPQNNGETITLSIPPISEERRLALVKQVGVEIEKGKVTTRGICKHAKESLKKNKKEGASEDSIHQAEEELQKLTDQFSKQLDAIFVHKEKDLMTI